jgi:hypothetical protein
MASVSAVDGLEAYGPGCSEGLEMVLARRHREDGVQLRDVHGEQLVPGIFQTPTGDVVDVQNASFRIHPEDAQGGLVHRGLGELEHALHAPSFGYVPQEGRDPAAVMEMEGADLGVDESAVLAPQDGFE